MENDPTIYLPCGQISDERATQVYTNAFLTAFEFVYTNRVQGDFFEFGTYRGYTARLTATLMKFFFYNDAKLYLYDSFEGLPEPGPGDEKSYEIFQWKVWRKGAMKLGPGYEKLLHKALSEIIEPERIIITKGFYNDTLPFSLPNNTKAAIINIDCDLYSSARKVLESVLEMELFQDGTIMLCDDYNCGRANPNMGERKALVDVFSAQKRFQYEDFFPYGWNGKAFIIHDIMAVD